MIAFKPLGAMWDLTPDYRRDTAGLYTTVCSALYRGIASECGPLSSTTCFMGGGFGSSMPGLPSWVRDYSQTKTARTAASEVRRVRYAWLYRASFQASSSPSAIRTAYTNWHPRERYSSNLKILHMGAHVDTVTAVGPCMVSSHKDDICTVLQAWVDLCWANTFRTYTEFRNAFSRVICGDVCRSVDRATTEDNGLRRATTEDFPKRDAWERLVNGNLHAVDMQGYGAGLNFAIWGRCFFTTRSGRMGLCYPNTKQGDEVWILSGACVPFVVRPRPLKKNAVLSPGRGSPPSHSLVGDCFLQGIMDCEVAQQEILEERPITLS